VPGILHRCFAIIARTVIISSLCWPGISSLRLAMNTPSEIAFLEYEIASLQFVAALTRVPRIQEAAKERLAVRRRRLRKLNVISLDSSCG
jgi:hypothetical protein